MAKEIDEAFIQKVFKQLASRRPWRPFYSEADMQLAVAWEIKQLIPEADVSLEHRQSVPGDVHLYIDIWIDYKQEVYPIELKYKTTKKSSHDSNELMEQGACPIGRYSFLKDISRIETLSSSIGNFNKGFAIMLTNEKKYYEDNQRQTIDNDFKIHQGRLIAPGTLKWHSNAPWTQRYMPLDIYGSYNLQWIPYHEEFKALICCISKNK